MKLFRAEEGRSEIIALSNLINQSQLALQDVRKKTAEETQILIDTFNAKSRELTKKLITLEEEALMLERRKEEALIPLITVENSLNEREATLKEDQKSLKDKEEELILIRRELEDKQEMLESFSSDLNARHLSISSLIIQSDKRLHNVNKREIAIAKKEKDYMAEIEKAFVHIKVKEEHLASQQDAVNAMKSVLLEKDKRLTEEKRLIESRQSTLESNTNGKRKDR